MQLTVKEIEFTPKILFTTNMQQLHEKVNFINLLSFKVSLCVIRTLAIGVAASI